MKALPLFAAGKDTSEIADILGITEPEAYNMLAKERKERRAAEIAQKAENLIIDKSWNACRKRSADLLKSLEASL